MIYTTTQYRALAIGMEEAGVGKEVEHIVIEDGVVMFIPWASEYLVIQEGKRPWWTNDLPLVVPEVLTVKGAAIRQERFSKCKGEGRCYAWCTGVHVSDLQVELPAGEEEVTE